MASYKLITLLTQDEAVAKKLIAAVSGTTVGGASAIAAAKLTKRTIGKSTYFLAQLLGSPTAIQPAQMLGTFAGAQVLVADANDTM
jgi:lipid-binding SYLF domain-containing protein